MKHLKEFSSFNMVAFLEGKTLMVTNVNDWVEFETKKHLGTLVEVVIVKDETQYAVKDDKKTSNRFEKMKIKVKKDVVVQLDDVVRLVNAVGVIYGEYQNQLSVTADDIQILQTKKG